MGCREQGTSTELLHRPAVVDKRAGCGRRGAPVTRGGGERGHMHLHLHLHMCMWEPWAASNPSHCVCNAAGARVCNTAAHVFAASHWAHVAAFLVACSPAQGG